ncbi:synaptotagmin-5 [Eucyclogobius newberryi]|uniref:synaptotagmin-5 n=1 Tax=Eucyclogobius newberryi TaxID=166745 RepID=UPI003B5925EC
MSHYPIGVHLQIVLAVGLAVLCYSVVLLCILCCRKKKKVISSEDKEAIFLSPYPPAVTLTLSQCTQPIKQQYEELDGDVLDFPLSKSSSSPSEDDLSALPSDHSPSHSPGLLLSPGVSVPLRRLSSPVIPCPPELSPVHGRSSLPSLTKLSLMSRSKRAKGRRSTVSGESFLSSEGSSLTSEPQLRDGSQYGAVPTGSKHSPLLHFSLLFSSAHGTLVVNILSVSGTSKKRSSVFVRASLPPLCPSPQPLSSTRRRSLSPEVHSQSVLLRVGPVEELHVCTLRLAVYSKDFSGLREAMLGLVEMPCEQMDLTSDTTCTFTREITPTKNKLKKSVSSQETLVHRKTSVCVPKVLGQVFILLQYQSLAQRIKLMVRKAEHLARLTRIPGTPDHYVVINMRQDGKVIATKETKVAGGLNPIWNAPFLFDLPPGDVTQLPVLFEFIIMQGRLYTKSSVLGHVVIGNSGPEEGQAHWGEMLNRGQIETARWHIIQPDVW